MENVSVSGQQGRRSRTCSHTSVHPWRHILHRSIPTVNDSHSSSSVVQSRVFSHSRTSRVARVQLSIDFSRLSSIADKVIILYFIAQAQLRSLQYPPLIHTHHHLKGGGGLDLTYFMTLVCSTLSVWLMGGVQLTAAFDRWPKYRSVQRNLAWIPLGQGAFLT